MADLTLTFDNGPEPDATPLVLDILARRGLRTTFFVIGEKLQTRAGRALAERAAEEGHTLGNHTWTHSGSLGTRVGETDLAERELGRTQRELGSLAAPHRYVRPQGGGGALGPHLLDSGSVDLIRREKMSLVLWNAIPRDWDDAEGWIARALAQIQAQPWTLMVLHDVPSGAMRHLDRFLDQVQEMGARLRPDFPPDCVPVRDGIVVQPIDGYVTTQRKESSPWP